MPMHLISSIPQPAWIAIGALLLILGLSFCYKGWNATVLGRTYYWSGFLPFTVVSPWFIHLPPGEKSLIKIKEGMLCHILVGPLFFLTAAPLLVMGCDLIGLPGTDTLNLVINHGDRSLPTAVQYSPPLTYNFPIAVRSSKQAAKIFNVQIKEDPKKRLLKNGELENAAANRNKYIH